MEHWSENFRDYAEDLLMIQTTDAKLVPFKFNNVQIALDEIIADIRLNGRLVRVVIDKLRRAGCSSYFAARNMWKTSMTPHTYALMITHEPEATDTIFGMVKRYHANMPKKTKPQVLYDNRKALVFNTKDRIGGVDSEIKVGTAGKENLGSSQLCNYSHWSEFSKWPAATIDALLTSLMPTVPDTEDSELIIESTANGMGNKYHEMYLEARYKYSMYLDDKGELAWKCEIDEQAPAGNTWSKVFIPWFVFEKCSIEVATWERQTMSKFELTEEERKFISIYLTGCPPTVQKQKMAWRRSTLLNKFKGNIKRFNQEYPATDIESFISSGETAFDQYQIMDMIRAAPDPIVKYEMNPKSGQVLMMPEGRLWVWKEPEPDKAYIISADVSKGIVVDEEEDEDSKYDSSACSVKEHLTGIEVAQFVGKIDPDLYGEMLYGLHMRYNQAWVIPEANNHGNTTITALLRRGCKKIYVEMRERPPNKPTREYGITTSGGPTAGVRFDMVDALISAVREHRAGIRSKRTLREFLTIIRNTDGKYEAQSKRHDDCFIAEAIAKYAIPKLPLPANARLKQGNPSGIPMLVPVPAPDAAGWG